MSQDLERLMEMDRRAESLCRWAAARAGAIALTPVIGAGALFINEVYMVMRLGAVYGERLTARAAKSFLLSAGGTLVGKGLAGLLPGFLRMPIAVSVTYGLGRAAVSWVRDGMPEDMAKYREVARRTAKEAESRADEIMKDERKDQPLGNEEFLEE